MKRAFSRKNLWDGLPRALKAAVGPVVGVIPPQYLLGRGFRRALHFVQEAQWWPATRAREYQLAQLRRICTIAYEKTPYYRRTFSAAGFDPRDLNAVEDLRRLPTISRETLRDHLHEMCAVPPWSPRVDYVTTAGTSGAPLRFYIGAHRSQVEYAYLVASWQRADFRVGTPLAVFRGRVVAENGSGGRHEYDPLLRQHFYSNFHMTDANMRRYVEHVSQIGPCFLHAYPSSAAALARFLRRSGHIAPNNIRGIIAESENVYPEQRQMVEQVFGCRYFSSYGHTEKVVAAAECEKTTNYHVWPTYGFFELLDVEGRPVARPGERGEIVGTGFINGVVPFIRYRTGDYATYIGDRCNDCGREQPIIADIRGHNIQESLVARDGSLIGWSAVNVHDDTFDNVRQFQFYQEVPGRASLRIVAAPGFAVNERSRIRRSLGKKLDGRLELSIELVDSIALSGRGKAIYVDQRIAGAQA
jgi:phenylacetate-CoA ligase